MKRTILLLTFVVTVSCMHAQRMLTLEECRNLAIQNNKELQISGEKIKMADNEKKAAFTKYFPQLSANGAYMWNQKDINLLDMGALSSSLSSSLGGLAQLPMIQHLMSGVNDMQHLDVQNIWVGNVSLVQPVFMGGKIVNYNQITKFAKQLAESMNNLQLQDLIYKTDETYWQVISLVNKKKLAEGYLKLLQKLESDVDHMIAEGVATKADGLSVKVKVNEAEMTLTKVEDGLSLSKMLLCQLCGLDLSTNVVLADENMNDLPILLKENSEINMETAYASRPELKSLELASLIYKQKVNVTRAEHLPTVALLGNYLVSNPSVYNGFENKFKGMWNVGVMVQVPIWNWGEGVYKTKAAKAEAQIAKYQLQDAREKVELQVNQAAFKVTEAKKKLIMASKNLEKANENLRYATLGFEEGVIAPANVLEAHTAWLSAQSEKIDAQIDIKLTEIYLQKSLGTLK
mgnify:CR=1 FL=1